MSRGIGRGPDIAYWDDVSDDVPGAISLLVPYQREGDRVRLKIELDKDGSTLAERELVLDESDAAKIAAQVVKAMMEMLVR